MKLLTQNSKMKKSSSAGITVVNWTIPAFQSSTGIRTCPNAGACAAGCYARSGTYAFSNVKSAHEEKLALTLTAEFVPVMIAEIRSWLGKRTVKNLKVRIHDAGDFYNLQYATFWFNIMDAFKSEPRVSFYAYTKQVKMFKTLNIPKNFHLIFSMGGKQDALIDVNSDVHSRVFETNEALEAAGYTNGTDDDLVAGLVKSHKIGLVYHGAKSYKNTAWSSVSKR